MFRLVVFIASRESSILTNLTGKRQDFARIAYTADRGGINMYTYVLAIL